MISILSRVPQGLSTKLGPLKLYNYIFNTEYIKEKVEWVAIYNCDDTYVITEVKYGGKSYFRLLCPIHMLCVTCNRCAK